MEQQAVFDEIKTTIENNAVVLFMKGSKHFPQCGCSATVSEMLSNLDLDYQDVNVLIRPELRQGIKDFTQWPTIPQLYVHGKFVGGCDIAMELYQTGELQKLIDAGTRP